MNGNEIDTSTYYVPAILALSLINATFVNLTIWLTIERERGQLKRVRATPVPAWVVIGGRTLTSAAIAAIMVVIVCGFGALLYGVELQAGSIDARTFFDKLVDGAELAVPHDPPDLRGYVELALRGGFPSAALSLSGVAHRMWMDSYLEHPLARVVQAATGSTTRSRDAVRLRRYFEACALNTAGEAEHKTIYDHAGVNRVTALGYDDLLERLFVIEEVPSWETNRLKRLTRAPKRYVVEPALVAAALRLDGQGVMNDGDLLGRLLDTFVAAPAAPRDGDLRLPPAASSRAHPLGPGRDRPGRRARRRPPHRHRDQGRRGSRLPRRPTPEVAARQARRPFRDGRSPAHRAAPMGTRRQDHRRTDRLDLGMRAGTCH